MRLRNLSGDFSAFPHASKERLRALDAALSRLGQKGRLSSGVRPSRAPSEHPDGGAADLVFDGDMPGIARAMKAAGFHATFERSGQKNANGSVATGDHIHVSLSKSAPSLDDLMRGSLPPALLARALGAKQKAAVPMIPKGGTPPRPSLPPITPTFFPEDRTRKLNQASRPAGPQVMVAGAYREEKRESPLWLKAARVPGKPADARNAAARRFVDELKKGAGVAQALTGAGKAGTGALADLNRDVPPTAVRAALGVKAGTSSRLAYNAATAADYALDWLLDPVGNVLGAGSKLASKSPRLVAGASRLRGAALSPLAKAGTVLAGTETGAAVSRLADRALGVGGTARMMREVKGAYEPALEKRLYEAGQVIREMRDWTAKRKREDPIFRRTAEIYRAGKAPTLPGARGAPRIPPTDPLTDLVKLYVQKVDSKGRRGPGLSPRGSRLDPAGLAEVRGQAAKLGVDPAVVFQFGDRLLEHGEETLGIIRASGGTPFVKARGLQYKKLLKADPVTGTRHIVGTTPQAKDRSEAFLRQKWFSQYLNEVAVRPKQLKPGEVGARGYSGSGLSEARRGALRTLVNDLTADGRFVRAVPPGAPLPAGWVRAKDLRDFDRLGGMAMPKPLYDYLANEGAQVKKVFTKFGREVGVPEDNVRRVMDEIATIAGRVTGAVKRNWLASVATLGGNSVGNHILAELAMSRAGQSGPLAHARFLKELAVSVGEVKQFAGTGKLTPDIAALSSHSRAFLSTEAATAGVRRGAGAAALSGIAGRSIGRGKFSVTIPTPDFTEAASMRAPLDKAVYGVGAVGRSVGDALSAPVDALVGLHGLSEQTYKLALFKTLRGQLGDKQASEFVNKYLFDYSDRPAMLAAADQFGVWVFNTFPTKAFALFADTLVNRPDLVARYPRLKRMVASEFPEQEGKEEKLPAYRRGDQTFPVAQDEPLFTNLDRMQPFAGPLAMARRAVDPDERAVPTARPLSDALGALEGNSILAPILAQLANRQLNSSPDDPRKIAEPGAPWNQALAARVSQFVKDVAPAQARGIGRVLESERGVASSGAKTAEPQERLDAILQGIFGIPLLRAESLPDRQERTEPLVETRLEAWEEEIDRITAEVEAGTRPNPYRGEFDTVRDVPALLKMMEDSKAYALGLAPRLVDKSGKMTPANKEKLKEAWLMYLAIAERADRLDAEIDKEAS